MVKILRPFRELMNNVDAKVEYEMEVQAATKFSEVDHVVPMTVEKIHLDGREDVGLIMPRLTTTLAKSPQLPLSAIVRESKNIKLAVEQVHRAGYVHMDIKPDNIFINQHGCWFLGDFGSCKSVGAKVTSSTLFMYPTNLIGKNVDKKYDLFMLALSILYASDLEHFADLNDGENRPDVNKIRTKLVSLSSSGQEEQQLSELATQLFGDML